MKSRRFAVARVMLAFGAMQGAALLAIVAGCAYQPGSFDTWGHDFAGRRSTVGCVDLSILRRGDHAANPVLAYDFGNRCDRPVTVDLQAVAVVAKATGGDAPMIPYDPDHEIRALPLDGRSAGSEAIEYRMTADAGVRLSVCVDAATVVDTTTSNWQCFDEPSGVPR
jgi:hypothetical protein